jgi:hypothetical protein
MMILPQVIHVSCKNNELSLCSDKLIGDSTLNFLIKNYNKEEILEYKYQIQSLVGNVAPKPDINIHSDKMQLAIPKVENPTKLHFSLSLKFSGKLTTKIIIDSIIIPFNYSFYVYDYDQKQYKNELVTVLYSPNFLDREIVLHCRITSPLFTVFEGKFNCRTEVKCNTPNEIYASDGFNRDICDQTDFEIKLKIKKTPAYSAKGSIVTVINGIVKTVFINFKKLGNLLDNKGMPNAYMINNYDFFYGIEENRDGEWKKIRNVAECKNFSVICSPFSVDFINLAKIIYTTTTSIKYLVVSSKCEVFNAKENTFVCLRKDGEIVITKQLFSEVTMRSNEYPLFGIVQNQWYPFFTIYNNELTRWKLLDIDKSFENVAKKIYWFSFCILLFKLFK